MRAIDLIERKRDGVTLTTEQIDWFVARYTAGEIPDYQAAALMMAIYFQGMHLQETIDLTLAMARSGEQLDVHDVVPFVVDKHSSGGVGDKTTLVVQPLVAACGVPVGKMSGRGLGLTGGTLDKMESFRGWSSKMSIEQFKAQLADIGLVLAGQTADLAPADGKLYALRDVTGTVGSIPLIAASIMSKKLATGADAIVLDVKVGSGAFMRTIDGARELAQIMVDIGRGAGRRMAALLSDMNQPLGYAVGNALEVREAIATLQGDGPADFWAHCLEVASHMLLLADKADSLEDARRLVTEALESGRGLANFRTLVKAQGGDADQVDHPERLPQAALVEPVTAPRDAYLAAVDTGEIGWAAVHLGAGRQVKGEAIDHAVGFLLTAKIGDRVSGGDMIGEIHANDTEKLAQAREELLTALTWSDEPVDALPHFHGVIN